MKSPKIPFLIRPIVGGVADKLYKVFVRPNVERHLSFLQGLLDTAPDGGPFLCGARLTAADVLMSYPLATARTRIALLEGKGNLLDAFPRLWTYLDRLEKSEGFKRAQAKIDELEKSTK